MEFIRRMSRASRPVESGDGCEERRCAISHLVQISKEFRSLEALRAALKELGLTLGGPGKVKFYYSDQAYGQSSEDQRLEQCDYTVELPGSKYGLGFRKTKTGFQPVGDVELFEGSYGAADAGRKLLGEKGVRLWERYAVNATKIQARRNGYLVSEERAKDGSLRIRVRVP